MNICHFIWIKLLESFKTIFPSNMFWQNVIILCICLCMADLGHCGKTFYIYLKNMLFPFNQIKIIYFIEILPDTKHRWWGWGEGWFSTFFAANNFCKICTQKIELSWSCYNPLPFLHTFWEDVINRSENIQLKSEIAVIGIICICHINDICIFSQRFLHIAWKVHYFTCSSPTSLI